MTGRTLPSWLTRHLEDTTGASLTARHAKPRLHTCGAWTLLGLDADVLAHTARVDPTPLTPQGELTALLTGRRTYLLTRTGGRSSSGAGRLVLDDRDQWRTRGKPPRPGDPAAGYDVVPAHQCGRVLDGPLVAGTNLTPRATSTTNPNDPAVVPF